MTTPNIYAVIMAGGVGSRFWPASKATSPKQLLDLTGSKKTMIQATVDRLSPQIPPERILVVTGKRIVQEVKNCLPQLPPQNILAEPEGRNTAPCIGWAALHVKQRDPDGIMAVMPSDHLVGHPDVFLNKMTLAVGAAREGHLVTFGIVPSGPETGFGYIETGTEVFDGVHRVARFVEKPDHATARDYLEAGNFVWNSGMFFFSAAVILNEIEKQMPSLYAGLLKIDAAITDDNEAAVLTTVFPELPSESIDYGIMENAKNILCVPVDFGWSDLGSWAAAYALSPKDADQNAIEGPSVIVDSSGCLVHAPTDKLVALVGVTDLVVVDTGDALMVCHMDKAQDVKKVVENLKNRGRDDLL